MTVDKTVVSFSIVAIYWTYYENKAPWRIFFFFYGAYWQFTDLVDYRHQLAA